ncbi:MAG TPA: ABC transporter ATP-binding protein [Candidatus Anoxymicrobiaceae bacterium]
MAVDSGVVTRPVVEASELYRFYHNGDDETFALRGVSLAVEAGEMVAVVGPSGSGKSTLLSCVAGLDEPDGGKVDIAGSRLTRKSEEERSVLRCKWIGMLLQSGNLVEHLTVSQNVDLARRLGGGDTDARLLLASVGLEEKYDAWPPTLSGGEAARAGLAVALANDPFVLLADEPTGEVDSANELVILDLLTSRMRRGLAVIVVTHSETVAQAASRVVRLRDGRVVDA